MYCTHVTTPNCNMQIQIAPDWLPVSIRSWDPRNLHSFCVRHREFQTPCVLRQQKHPGIPSTTATSRGYPSMQMSYTPTDVTEIDTFTNGRHIQAPCGLQHFAGYAHKPTIQLNPVSATVILCMQQLITRSRHAYMCCAVHLNFECLSILALRN